MLTPRQGSPLFHRVGRRWRINSVEFTLRLMAH
jgi:hypothetical protein